MNISVQQMSAMLADNYICIDIRDEITYLHQFLKDAGTYYLATEEGSIPKVRPFGTALLFEDKIYILTAKTKNQTSIHKQKLIIMKAHSSA